MAAICRSASGVHFAKERIMCYFNGILFILAMLFAVLTGGTLPTV
jgi:hypothetical protein